MQCASPAPVLYTCCTNGEPGFFFDGQTSGLDDTCVFFPVFSLHCSAISLGSGEYMTKEGWNDIIYTFYIQDQISMSLCIDINLST